MARNVIRRGKLTARRLNKVIAADPEAPPLILGEISPRLAVHVAAEERKRQRKEGIYNPQRSVLENPLRSVALIDENDNILSDTANTDGRRQYKKAHELT